MTEAEESYEQEMRGLYWSVALLAVVELVTVVIIVRELT